VRCAAVLALAGAALTGGPAAGVPVDAAAALADTSATAVDAIAAPADTGAAAVDTAAAPARRPGSRQPESVGFFRSPTGIMLRSVVVPGWGQATNGSWVKAGVAVVVEGALIASIVRESQRLQDQTPGTAQYEDTYNQRQQAIWWLGAAVLLSMIDAYVDAHLKSGDVELGPEPGPDGLTLAARVRWR
jgi:hypothetical protein